MLHSSECFCFCLGWRPPVYFILFLFFFEKGEGETDERCSTVPGAVADRDRFGIFLLESLFVCHELRLDCAEVLLARGESRGLVYRPV